MPERSIALILSIFMIVLCVSCASPGNAPTAADASASPGGTTLTIASVTETKQLQYAVSAFEKAHPGVDVQLTNFSAQIVGMKTSGQAVDIGPMIQTLNTQMMSGAGPDIIDTDYLPYYKYINKDLLQDLGALMGGSAGLDESQYCGNVLDACKIAGKLYAVPSCFTFSVLSSRRQYSPGPGNATMRQFLAKASSLPGGVFAFAKNDPMQIFSSYMQDNYCNFIDYGTRTATFSSPAFIDTIKAFKTLFDTKMSGVDVEDGKEFEQLMNGTVAYSVQMIRRDMDVAMAKSALGDTAAFTNVPVAGDAGVYPFMGRDMLAINAGSKQQELAWEFVRTMLSADVQTNGSPDGFPVLKAAYQSKLDQMSGEKYILDKSGKRAVVKFGSADIEIKPLTAADTAWLSGRIGKLNKLSAFDDTISKIVGEELPPFFAGQKSAEDVAALIQNRVNIVLNE